MAALPSDIDFKVDKSASPERMNRAMTAIDGRLRALETYRPNFDALLSELQQVGLNRISEAVVPIVEGLGSIQALGFLNAPIQEGTTAQFQLGPVTVRIAQDRRGFFTPSPWLMMLSDANQSDYVLGKLVSYNQTTGVLVLNITNIWGTTGLFHDVTVWGVAGGALSAIESAASASNDRALAQTAASGAAASAAAASLAASNAATQAGSAAGSATAAADSVVQAAAIVATIENGPVTSVNGKTGVVALTASDVNAYSKNEINSIIDPGTF